MVFKSIGITCYPTSLGDVYNCRVTDQRQTQITKTMNESSVYLYDLDKSAEITEENKNAVSLYASRKSGDMTLAGYAYVTNSVTTNKQLSNFPTTASITIDDLRDPKAKIIFYGGGVGTINGSNFSKSFTIGGKTLTVSGNYTIANNNSNSFTTSINFNYPMSSTTYKVKVNYSGNDNVESYENWSVGWRVSTTGGVSGSGTDTSDNIGSSGRAIIQRPYNSNSSSDPKAVIRLAHLIADYDFYVGGYDVTYIYAGENFSDGYVNNAWVGYVEVPYGTRITNYSETSSTYYFPYNGNLTVYAEDGWPIGEMYINYVRIQKEQTYTEPGHEGGVHYRGQIRYEYNQSPEWWVEQWES